MIYDCSSVQSFASASRSYFHTPPFLQGPIFPKNLTNLTNLTDFTNLQILQTSCKPHGPRVDFSCALHRLLHRRIPAGSEIGPAVASCAQNRAGTACFRAADFGKSSNWKTEKIGRYWARPLGSEARSVLRPGTVLPWLNKSRGAASLQLPAPIQSLQRDMSVD